MYHAGNPIGYTDLTSEMCIRDRFMRHRARRMEHRIARAVGTGSMVGAAAVSYTHLDVYKRPAYIKPLGI